MLRNKKNINHLLFGLALFILPVNITMPEMPDIPEIDFEDQMHDIQSDTTFTIYQDSDYSNPTINFEPNKTVYVKVITSVSDNAVLTLLDGDKAEILKVNMEHSGDSYVANFTTPNSSGVFYVRVDITGEGTSFVGEKNINVSGDGESLSDVNVSTTIVNNVNSNGSDSATAAVKGESTNTNPDNAEDIKEDFDVVSFLQTLYIPICHLLKNLFL